IAATNWVPHPFRVFCGKGGKLDALIRVRINKRPVEGRGFPPLRQRTSQGWGTRFYSNETKDWDEIDGCDEDRDASIEAVIASIGWVGLRLAGRGYLDSAPPWPASRAARAGHL